MSEPSLIKISVCEIVFSWTMFNMILEISLINSSRSKEINPFTLEKIIDKVSNKNIPIAAIQNSFSLFDICLRFISSYVSGSIFVSFFLNFRHKKPLGIFNVFMFKLFNKLLLSFEKLTPLWVRIDLILILEKDDIAITVTSW